MNNAVRSAVAVLLMSSAGCEAAMSDARRDHILAADHGWIDLTLDAPAQPLTDVAKPMCQVGLTNNGEHVVNEAADLSQAQSDQNLVGYRFAAPAGKLELALTITECMKTPIELKLPLQLSKDHLAKVIFDGKELVLKGAAPYEPTSLEWVREQVLKLQSENVASTKAISTLTMIAIASLSLNLLALLVLMARWRGRKNE